MDKTKEEKEKKNKNKKQIDEDYSKNITYSTSKSESLDLLDIVEMYLCRNYIKI